MSKNYDLFTDSACDRQFNKLNQDTRIIPIPVTFGTEPFSETASTNEFYARLASQPANTSAINPDEFITAFTPSLAAGRDIIYLSMTASLSSTYQNSLIAADELRETFPDRRIECIDSNCVSGGQALLVSTLADLRRSGASIDELINFAANNWRNTIHLFTIDEFKYLHRSGRINLAERLAGGLVGMVPILHLSSGCKLTKIKATRGKKAAYSELAKAIKATILDPTGCLYLHHGACPEKVEALKAEIEKVLPDLHIIWGDYIRINSVIGAHVGPSVIAIFYFGTDRDAVQNFLLPT